MSVIINGTDGVTFNDSSLQGAAASPFGLKNRIINGAMQIDQRNAGAAITPTSAAFSVDRWVFYPSQASKFTIQQNAGSVTPPAGFTKYLGFTVASAVTIGAGDYFTLEQPIEGLNVVDLDWGQSTAKTVTLSFWVRSSLTGTFGGAIYNSAQNYSYAFNYTISSANTWEKKSITITAPTTGTFSTDNTSSFIVTYSLGVGATYSGTAGVWAASNLRNATGSVSVVGTNGATWYVTGVQLEVGSTATPFERRLYNQELANCQRYFNTSYFGSGSAVGTATTTNQVAWIAQSTGNYNGIALTLPVQMRVAPAITTYSGLNGASGNMNAVTVTISAAALTASTTSFNVFANNVSTTYSSNLYFHYTASSEL
jgi:hypothetical protein